MRKLVAFLHPEVKACLCVCVFVYECVFSIYHHCQLLMSYVNKLSHHLCVFLQRDSNFLKQEFVKVYMSSIYFLLHSPSLPGHRWADPVSEEQRARVIYATLDSLKHTQHTTGQSGGPEVFIDPMHPHLAFDAAELTFDLLNVAR